VKNNFHNLWATVRQTSLFGKTFFVSFQIINKTYMTKAEKALMQKSYDWERTFNSVPDSIAIIDTQHKIVRVNKAMAHRLGMEPEQLVGMNCFECVHNTDLPPDFCPHSKTMQDGLEHTTEVYNRRLGGYFIVTTTPLIDEMKRIIGSVHVARDITERKKMEEELRDTLTASHLRQLEVSALLEASKAVLQHREFKNSARAIFDSCRDLLGATAGYVALLSKDKKENEVLFLDAGGLSCTVDSALPMPIRGLRGQVYVKGKVVYHNDFAKSRWQKLMPEGHVALRNVLFSPLSIDGKIVGLIGVANKPDGFTERDAEMAAAFGKIASIALINSRVLETLEETVEERTKQLKESERLAAIGATAGMVGHDIRNPLQAIVGDVYLLGSEMASLPEGEEKENMKESLEAIRNCVDYIDRVVQDLQDFARGFKPILQETDFEGLCQHLLFKNRCPENVDVSLKIEKAAKKIVTDSTMLRRILTNLINNAVQAMPDGGELEVRAYREQEEYVITVKDSGVGVPEEHRDELFAPLFTTKSKGQGFGLAVVKRMTEALGGTVTFESEVGKGSKFILRLPKSQKLRH
jgi:PAS domain S-box-containing protein